MIKERHQEIEKERKQNKKKRTLLHLQNAIKDIPKPYPQHELIEEKRKLELSLSIKFPAELPGQQKTKRHLKTKQFLILYKFDYFSCIIIVIVGISSSSPPS